MLSWKLLFILEVTVTCHLNLMSNILLKSVGKNRTVETGSMCFWEYGVSYRKWLKGRERPPNEWVLTLSHCEWEGQNLPAFLMDFLLLWSIPWGKELGKDGFIWLNFSVRLRQEAQTETTEERMLLIGLFSYITWRHMPRVATIIVSCDLPHQSSIEKIPQRLVDHVQDK